jgi:hypothetical protein
MMPVYQSTHEIQRMKIWTMTNGLHLGLLLAKQIGAVMVTQASPGKSQKMTMTKSWRTNVQLSVISGNTPKSP